MPHAETTRKKTIGASPLWVIAFAALGLIIIAALAFQLCLMQHGRDQGIYSVVAQVMLDGGAPYKDAWDFKTPGIFFAYALAHGLFGPAMYAPRILEALALLSMVGGLVLLSRRLLGHWLVGIAAGVVALFYHVNLRFWDTAQPESFGGALVVWALVLATYRASDATSRSQLKQNASWAGCAALFALAAIFKPPLGGGILFAFAAIAAREWRSRTETGAVRKVGAVALSFLVGGGLIVGLLLIYLVGTGAWASFHYTFWGYVPHYTTLSFSWTALPRFLFEVFTKWPAAAHPFVWIGILLALAPPRVHAREKEALFLVLGAAAAQIVGVALQAKFFAYHYGGLVPLAAFLAVWGYAKLASHRRARWALIVVAILGIHYASTQASLFERSAQRWEALTNAETSDEINDRLHTLYDVNAQPNRVVAEWIAENTPADQPIFVWGFEPTIYVQASRRSASRYFYNVIQRSAWDRDNARRVLIEDLKKSKPSVIITLKRDRCPHVVGNNLDSEQALEAFPSLLRLMGDRYQRAGEAQDLTVYLRQDLVPEIQQSARPEVNISPLKRHILLLTIDTLRPDYLSSQGYPLPTTPTLDALYESATVFTRAVTPIPRTTQALASLLTGRYPHATKVRTLLDRLSPNTPSLAEIARHHGYETVAIVSNHLLTPERGLDRGFDTYDFADDSRSAKQTTEAAKEALRQNGADDPIFLWVHYIDPHVPYYPEETTARAFSPNYDGRYRHYFGQVYGGTGNRAYPADLPKRVAVYENPLSDEVNAQVRRLYAADIRDTDNAIAELLTWLKSRFGDDWTIVFTSDHGESLGEHDFHYDHGDYVYDASARVPLAVALPSGHPAYGARVVDDRVSLVDLAPTMIDLLGWNVSPELTSQFGGRSLAPCLEGGTLPSRALFAECGRSYYPDMIEGRVRFDVAGRFRAVWKDEWKLIWTPFQQDETEHQLYNVAEDPAELEDLSDAHRDKVTELMTELQRWLAGQEAAPALQELSEEEYERLKSLGYIGD